MILRVAAESRADKMPNASRCRPRPGRSRLATCRHPELLDLKSYRQAFRNAAAQVVARAHVRGLSALPSSSRSDETRVLAVTGGEGGVTALSSLSGGTRPMAIARLPAALLRSMLLQARRRPVCESRA